jgi:hypothetical protein
MIKKPSENCEAVSPDVTVDVPNAFYFVNMTSRKHASPTVDIQLVQQVCVAINTANAMHWK